ncbi:hypothetical protein [Erwinia amylovora]|nr:hypothetical protein [Erwinia amylovora]
MLVIEPQYIVFDEPSTLLFLLYKRIISFAIAVLEQTAMVVSH